MFPPKILAVITTEDYCLIIEFDNKVIKKCDLSIKIDEPRFSSLRTKGVLEDVKIVKGGYGIYWDDCDISENELWNDSVEWFHNFTVDDIHILRRLNYEKNQSKSWAEIISDTKKEAEVVEKNIEDLRKKRRYQKYDS